MCACVYEHSYKGLCVCVCGCVCCTMEQCTLYLLGAVCLGSQLRFCDLTISVYVCLSWLWWLSGRWRFIRKYRFFVFIFFFFSNFVEWLWIWSKMRLSPIESMEFLNLHRYSQYLHTKSFVDPYNASLFLIQNLASYATIQMHSLIHCRPHAPVLAPKPSAPYIRSTYGVNRTIERTHSVSKYVIWSEDIWQKTVKATNQRAPISDSIALAEKT